MTAITNQKEILINIRTKIIDASDKFRKQRAKLKQEIDKTKAEMARVKDVDMRSAKGKSEFGTAKARKEYMTSLKEQARFQKGALNKSTAKQGELMGDLNHKYAKGKVGLDKLNLAQEKGQRAFQGWALSLMFAGMALTKMSTGIWKSTTKVFQEISHSVEGNATAFDELAGGMKYLAFTVGSALEPLAEQLLPIALRVADWVQNNEALVASFVKWGAILGTVLTSLGMIVLAYEGFAQLATITNTKLVPDLKKLAGFMMTPVGLGIAALIALGAVSWKALKETPEAMDSIKLSLDSIDFDPMMEAVDSLFVSITGLSLGWEGIAWTIAWVVEKSVPFITTFAETFGIAAGMVDGLVTSLSMIGPAVRGDTEKIAELRAHLQSVDTIVKGLQGSENTLANAFSGLTTESITEFRDRRLAEQAPKESAGTGNSWEDDKYLANSEGFRGGQTTVVVLDGKEISRHISEQTADDWSRYTTQYTHD